MRAPGKFTMIAGEPSARISREAPHPRRLAELEPFERFAQSFDRLSERQQVAFFDLHAEAIERWNASRSRRRLDGSGSIAR